jgi:hypothetical protein
LTTQLPNSPSPPARQVNLHPKGKPPLFKRMKNEAVILPAVMDHNSKQ